MRKRSCGTYRAATTRHTVIGRAIIRPIGPHSHVQKSAENITPTIDTPVVVPYTHGSTPLLNNNSRPIYRPTTSSGCVQPFEWPSETRIGSVDAIHGPMYGTNLSEKPSTPHSMAAGTPMTNKPRPTHVP